MKGIDLIFQNIDELVKLMEQNAPQSEIDKKIAYTQKLVRKTCDLVKKKNPRATDSKPDDNYQKDNNLIKVLLKKFIHN